MRVTRSQASAVPWPEVFKNLNAVGAKYGVEIRSDVAVGTEQVDHIAALTRKAYRFDRVLHDASAAALNRPLIVGLASDALAGGRGGFSALGPDTLVGPLFRFSPDVKNPGWGRYALAHELNHLIMNRLGANVGKVPVYLFEGDAVSKGARFLVQEPGAPSDFTPLETMARELATVTRAEAAQALHGFRAPSDFHGKTAREVGRAEHIGGLFVEFLRVRLIGPTADARLGRVWLNIGKGENFESAFAAVMGQTLAATEGAFLDFIANTSKSADERFSGTVFAGR